MYSFRNYVIFICRFFAHYGFPGVIGCIDCTHVAIFPPKNEDVLYPEYLYVNRKGYHSINVQLVINIWYKLIHILHCFNITLKCA